MVTLVRSMDELPNDGIDRTAYVIKSQFVKSRNEYRHSFFPVVYCEADAWDSYFEEPYASGEYYPAFLDEVCLVFYSPDQFKLSSMWAVQILASVDRFLYEEEAKKPRPPVKESPLEAF